MRVAKSRMDAGFCRLRVQFACAAELQDAFGFK
jgi:hypothetical protein